MMRLLSKVKAASLCLPIVMQLFMFMLLLESPSFAATYYVDATGGNDNNQGLSVDTAWKTIRKVNSTSFQPGDQILFKRDEIWREQLNIPSSGEENQPVTFGTYGTGNNPVIKQADPYSDDVWSLSYDSGGVKVWEAYYNSSSIARGITEDGQRRSLLYIENSQSPEQVLGNLTCGPKGSRIYYRKDSGRPVNTEIGVRDHAILVYNRNNIIVEGLDCEGPGASQMSRFINPVVFIAGSSKNIVIRNLKITKASETAINSENTTANVEFNNITATDSGSNGIGIRSHGGAVRNCKVFENGRLSYDSGDRAGIGVGNYGGSNIMVVGNEVYRNGQDDQDADYEISVFEPSGPITITRNYVHDCIQGCIQIASIGGSGSEISYNVIAGFGTTSYDAEPTTGKYSAIRLYRGGDTISIKVANNIIAGGGEAARTKEGYGFAQSKGGFQGTVVKNNIFYNNACPDIGIINTSSAEIEISNNLYYKVGREGEWVWDYWHYNELEAWQAVSGQDSASIYADPLFKQYPTDFHLNSGSPAIDTGVDVGLSQDLDLNFVPYGSAPDLGAYEYGYSGPSDDPDPINYGDVSGNGHISAYDASLAARFAVGLIGLSQEEIVRADVSGNGGVSATDAAWIAQRAVDPNLTFPVEEQD